jgi:hypothetical protein
MMDNRRGLKAVPDKADLDEEQRERAPDLRDAVKTAVDAMTWLGTSDGAMKTLALRIAEEIEKAIDRAAELERIYEDAFAIDDDRIELIFKRVEKLKAMCDVTKTVGWLGPQLQGVLRDLGGTPAARKALGSDQPVGGRLAQIRRDAEAAAARKDNA